jgi:hypothetical protein
MYHSGYFKNHPERQDDEIFLGFFDDTEDCLDGTGRTSWECVGWKTRRQGNFVDPDAPSPSFPVFVKQDEIRQYTDGQRLLAGLIPQSMDARIEEVGGDNMGVMTSLLAAKESLPENILAQFLDMVGERSSALWDRFNRYKKTVPPEFGFFHFILSVVKPPMPTGEFRD